ANTTPRIVQSSIIFTASPMTHKTDEVNMPSARVTTRGKDGREQTFIVSTFLSHTVAATSLAHWAQENGLPVPTRSIVRCDGREFIIELRFARQYKYFGGAKACKITLLEFNHERYPGPSVDKAFSSRIRLSNPNTGEVREALISMNTPLRYGGE